MGLLIVQLIIGGYQFSFVADAGRAESSARASRLPDPAVFGHMLTGIVSTLVWIVWLSTQQQVIPWIAVGTLALGGAIGLFMASRTLGKPTIVSADAVRFPDRADVVAAEKRIPTAAIALHGLIATLLFVFALLVALGVGN